ncbi:hypothetical protein [Pseudarthrobacter sp. S6]|uniref:hypothetical protein n=1 Tax=Pseudarthrobacter sp. S6 TaxID=3418420 RepID=UPI003CF4C693
MRRTSDRHVAFGKYGGRGVYGAGLRLDIGADGIAELGHGLLVTSVVRKLADAMVIAVYASISKELGIPFRFPGKAGAYTSLIEMTDLGLLAEATVWAATNPEGQNQAFNITNGDMFRWSSMRPKIAEFFDLDVAPPLPMSLSDVMADKSDLWDAMVAKHALAKTPYSKVSSWQFGDFVFAWDYDVIADTSKSRRASFNAYVESEEMFLRIFQNL